MRKVVSTLMAFMILLSILNLTVGAHLCHDRVMAVKMSITGEKPHSCGMEDTDISSPVGSSFKNKCCSNESALFKVDSNYSPSFFKNITVFQKDLHYSAVLMSDLLNIFVTSRTSKSNFSPPYPVPPQSVDLATVCVFRI